MSLHEWSRVTVHFIHKFTQQSTFYYRQLLAMLLLLLLLHVVTSSENGNKIGKRNMVQREKSGREKQQQFYEWKKKWWCLQAGTKTEAQNKCTSVYEIKANQTQFPLRRGRTRGGEGRHRCASGNFSGLFKIITWCSVEITTTKNRSSVVLGTFRWCFQRVWRGTDKRKD